MASLRAAGLERRRTTRSSPADRSWDLRRHADAVLRAARKTPTPPGSASSPGRSAGSPTSCRARRCSGTSSSSARPTTRCSPVSATTRGCTSCTRCTACPTTRRWSLPPATTAARVNAAFRAGNVFATQFHPEKSGRVGPAPAAQLRASAPLSWRDRQPVRDRPVPRHRPARRQVVRLLQGDYDDQTTYGDDPVAVARSFADAGAPLGPRRRPRRGAQRLARSTGRSSPPSPRRCTAARTVQTGGGVRTVATRRRSPTAGVRRVVMGSAAVRDPSLVAEARRASCPVAVGLDHRDGEVAVHGWTEGSGRAAGRRARLVPHRRRVRHHRHRPRRHARRPRRRGPRSGGGARPTIPVIASGGVASLADVAALRRCRASPASSPARRSTRAASPWPRGARCAGPRDEGRTRHPVPRRHQRSRREGHQLRRAARRRRPGRAGGALRPRGRRRAGVPRHHRVVRRPRHHGRRGRTARPSRCSSRSPSAAVSVAGTTRAGCCAPAPTRSASTPPRCNAPS